MFVHHHRACARQAMGERANITGLSNKLIAIPGAGHVPVSVALPTSQHYLCPFRCVVCFDALCGFRLLRLFSYGCCALVCAATAADQRHRGRRRVLPRPGARVHHRVDGPGTRGVSSQESRAHNSLRHKQSKSESDDRRTFFVFEDLPIAISTRST